MPSEPQFISSVYGYGKIVKIPNEIDDDKLIKLIEELVEYKTLSSYDIRCGKKKARKYEWKVLDDEFLLRINGNSRLGDNNDSCIQWSLSRTNNREMVTFIVEAIITFFNIQCDSHDAMKDLKSNLSNTIYFEQHLNLETPKGVIVRLATKITNSVNEYRKDAYIQQFNNDKNNKDDNYKDFVAVLVFDYDEQSEIETDVYVYHKPTSLDVTYSDISDVHTYDSEIGFPHPKNVPEKLKSGCSYRWVKVISK